jgi:LmbE family N-acetylglucosaminyl deacetylase
MIMPTPPRGHHLSTFVPDGVPLEEAFRRITHLGIGAHQDDLEIMAFHGIARCFGDAERWFGGITCTDGAGSPRSGIFAEITDEQMVDVRHAEQEQAARLGEYGVMAQLGYASAAFAEPANPDRDDAEAELVGLLERMAPQVVYTHNLADKHETHVGVAMSVLRAIRRLPAAARPQTVYGCEVWRDLDWMADDDVVVLDVGSRPRLAEELVAVFASQIAGGKRYDLAAAGRRLANATFRAPGDVDRVDGAWLAMDLTPLIADDAPEVEDFVETLLRRFTADVRDRLRRHGAGSD